MRARVKDVVAQKVSDRLWKDPRTVAWLLRPRVVKRPWPSPHRLRLRRFLPAAERAVVRFEPQSSVPRRVRCRGGAARLL
mgnify:CR=1 FL=1